MRKIFLVFTLLLFGIIVNAQKPDNYTTINARYYWLAGKFKTLLLNDTTALSEQEKQYPAIASRGDTLWIWSVDGQEWTTPLGISGANNYLTAGVFADDTITLSRSGLSPISISLNNRYLKLSDSASMLATYLRAIDTSGHWITDIYQRNDTVFYILDGTETYAYEQTGTGVSDGDKGEITVTSGVWTVDDGVIDDDNIADVAFSKITGTPTTLAGYGITDGLTQASADLLYEPIITAGTTLQYWRGDKSWQTLPVFSLNGLTGTTQTFTEGHGFDISSSGTAHTFDLDSAIWQTRLRGLHLFDSLNAIVNDSLAAHWAVIEALQGSSGGSSTLAGLSDVTLASLANGDRLMYNSGTGEWNNVADTNIYKYDGSLTSARTITGGAYGLSVGGYSGSGSALSGIATATGTGLFGRSVDGWAGRFSLYPASTNTVVPILDLNRYSTGTGANGIGGSVDFNIDTDTQTELANKIISKWVNATQASRTSHFDIDGVNGGVDETYMNIQPSLVRINNNADTLATRAYARSVGGSGGSGEANTASNLGGGLANYDSKSGVDLRFNSFNATDFDLASNLISIDATLKSTWNGKMSNPMTTTGDIIYSSDGSGTPARLAAGTNGHVLTLASGLPTWAAASGSGWGLTGNAGTTAGTNFLGTTDAIDLVFKTGGTERARFVNSSGNFGVGGSPYTSTRLYSKGSSTSALQYSMYAENSIGKATFSVNNEGGVGVGITTSPTTRSLISHGFSEFSNYIKVSSYGEFQEMASPGTATAGYARMFVKADGLFYGVDDSGNEKKLSNPTLTKSIVLESPTASESISFGGWRTPVAITISAVHAIVEGSSPSVTFNIAFGTDITSLTNVFTSNQTVTSSTTGTTFNTGFNDQTIPAGSWIKIITSASTTPTSLAVSFTYTED